MSRRRGGDKFRCSFFSTVPAVQREGGGAATVENQTDQWGEPKRDWGRVDAWRRTQNSSEHTNRHTHARTHTHKKKNVHQASDCFVSFVFSATLCPHIVVVVVVVVTFCSARLGDFFFRFFLSFLFRVHFLPARVRVCVCCMCVVCGAGCSGSFAVAVASFKWSTWRTRLASGSNRSVGNCAFS